MNNQEIYNKVKEHLLSQMAVSNDDYGDDYVCAYRGENGLKCAIGCLIEDQFYSRQMEGSSIRKNLLVREALRKSGVEFSRNTKFLLNCLQDVHDNYPAKDWAELLKEVAIQFGLEP